MSDNPKRFYEFGEFRLDEAGRRLLRARGDGEAEKGWEEVPLQQKAFDVLLSLVRQSHDLIGRDKFLDEVWPDATVEQHRVTANVSTLRRALGDDKGAPRFIRTVPGKGYRFVADVREVVEEGIVAERTRTRVLVEETDEDEAVAGAAEDATLPEVTAGPAPALPPAAGKPRPRRALPKSPLLLAAAAALVGCAALAAYVSISRRAAGGAAPEAAIKSIAVLPFKPLDAASRDEALELGMADTLITRLSAVRDLVVRPTSAVRSFTDVGADPFEIGRRLQVESVLEGHIQRAGDRVRVTLRLVRVEGGGALWAERFDEKYTDIFALQDSISERVVAALGPRLSRDEAARLTKHHTEDAEAYQLYVRGRYHWNRRTADGMRKAIEYFSRAIRSDPSYALAYAGLADSYALLPEYSNAPFHESLAEAKAASLKALDIDNTLAEAHVSLAYAKHSEWDWAGVEDGYRRGLALNPNYATGHQWYSEYLVFTGRLDEAMEEIKLAQRLDPLSLIINNRVGMTYYFSRRYDEAIEQLRKTLEFDPDFILTHVFLYASLSEKGMHREAIPHLAKGFFHVYPPEEQTRIEAALTSAYKASGEKGLWEEVRDILKGAEKRDYNHPYHMAETYMRLGDKDAAFLWLQKATDVRHPGVAALKVEPAMDGLRSDPRYAELLRRLNL